MRWHHPDLDRVDTKITHDLAVLSLLGKPLLQPKLKQSAHFALSAEIAQRFNAYASAAYPYEIGGLLRVEQQEDGSYLTTDLHIFRQAVSPIYFELDGSAVAEFNLNLLRGGRKEEISQWRSLIHSHPKMTPFMSGPDRENLERLAGESFAFSVICSAQANPQDNYFAAHYAQKQPLALMIHDLPVSGENLAGLELLTNNELQTIETEVAQLCSGLTTRGRKPCPRNLVYLRDIPQTSRATTPIFPTRPSKSTTTFLFDTSNFNDLEYEHVDHALSRLLQSRDSSSEEIGALLALTAGGHDITERAQAQLLLSAIIAYREELEDEATEHLPLTDEDELGFLGEDVDVIEVLSLIEDELQDVLADEEELLDIPHHGVARAALHELPVSAARTRLYQQLLRGSELVVNQDLKTLSKAIKRRIHCLIEDGGEHGVEFDCLEAALAAIEER